MDARLESGAGRGDTYGAYGEGWWRGGAFVVMYMAGVSGTCTSLWEGRRGATE